MNEYRIYTKRMAEYLTAKGFEILQIVPSVLNPKYKNWIFKDSPELQLAITEYTRLLHT